MGENRTDLLFLPLMFKSLHLFWPKGLALPLVIVLGEELDRLTADGITTKNRLVHAAGNRHVRTEKSSCSFGSHGLEFMFLYEILR